MPRRTFRGIAAWALLACATLFAGAAAAQTAATGAPTISGSPQVGETLTAGMGDIADADNLPTTTFPVGYTFQWVREDSDGSNPTDIPGATAQTYPVIARDRTKKIKVKVSFTDGGGNSETLTSEATIAILAARGPCAAGYEWCAVMTVGTQTFGTDTYYGYDGIQSMLSDRYGELTDTSIEYGGSTYTVESVDVINSQVLFNTNVHLPSNSVFNFRQIKFSGTMSDEVSGGTRSWLFPTGFTRWVVGEKVTLSANLPPFLQSATVFGNQLVLVYHETLDSGSKPAANSYSVSVNGGSGVAPSNVKVAGKKVTLTLRTAVTAGQTVELDYTEPGSDPVRDEYEVAAHGFTDRSVDNSTPVNCPTGNDWCASLTVGTTTTAPSGTSYGFVDSPRTGALPDQYIDNQGTRYAVDAITINDFNTGQDTVTVFLDRSLPSGSVFNLSGTAFVANAGETTTPGYYLWNRPSGFSNWTAGNTVTVSVSIPDTAGIPGVESLGTCSPNGHQVSLSVSSQSGSNPSISLNRSEIDCLGTVRNYSVKPRTEVTIDVQPRDEDFTISMAIVNGGYTDIVNGGYTVDGRTGIFPNDEGWIVSDTLTASMADLGQRHQYAVVMAEKGEVGTVGHVRQYFHIWLDVEESNDPWLEVADALGHEDTDRQMEFAVTLSPAHGTEVTVDYATEDYTATAGADYRATSGTLTFAPGETSKTVTVRVLDDTIPDDGETFRLKLSNATGVRISDGMGIGTINNTEGPLVSVADASATEGSAVAFTVSLSEAGSESATVEYATSGDTATSGTDFTEASGTLTFAAGETSKTVSVATTDDATDEEDETFTLTLSGPTNLRLGTSTATGTIEDDDEAGLTASFENAPASHDGSTTFTLQVLFSEALASGGSGRKLGQALELTGATRGEVRRVDGRRDLYSFPVHPSGDGAVTVSLSATTGECDANNAICTAEGRKLSAAVSAEIAGPVVTPTLTAAFENVPSEHDGSSAFTLRVSFSEAVETSFVKMRDEAFTVTGGSVTSALRVDGQSDLWEIRVEPDGNDAVTVTLPATTGECTATGAICTSDGLKLSAAVSAEIAGPPVTPLTASFSDVPAEHDGSSAFTLTLTFSEAPEDMSYRTVRDSLFTVSGGRIKSTRRTEQGSDLGFNLTVEPSGNGAVTLSLATPLPACGQTGAVCASGGRSLTGPVTATIQGPPALSVADSEADEDPNAALAFAVTLSRAASGPVTVAYATANGTAVAGSDYTAVSGTLSFAAGETSKTIQVALIDDSVDDDGETLTLTLSNPSGAFISDGTATGTINNSDPMPQAWLVRFGRTAADHAVEAIGMRFEGDGETSHATFAGLQLWGGAPGAGPLDADNDPFGFGTGIGYGLGHHASPYARQPGTFGAQPGMDMNAGSGMGMNGMGAGMNAGAGLGAGMGAGMDPGSGMSISGVGGHRPALRDLLIGSSFLLSTGSDRRLTTWGRASATRFDGAEDNVRLDGDVATFLIGADTAWDRWLAGISVAHTIGSGGFSGGVDEGDLDSMLTAVYPYVSVQATDRLSAWGVLGYGAGSLKLETDDSTWRTDTSMSMAAVGLRGVLLRTEAGLELAARTDVRFTQSGSDAAVGDAGLLGETSGGTSRVRLLLEGTRPFAFGSGRMLTPSLQLGVRRDGGDAENGAGFDLGGTLRYADAALGLSVEASGRYLLAHEDSAYREWGASASISVDPGIPGRGLTLSVAPSWGADASGGAERLWSARDARGLAGYGFDTDMRLQAQVGYGFAAFKGKGSMAPFAALSSVGPSGCELRAGAHWERGQSLQMSLAGMRREVAGQRPEHGVEFRLTWRPGAR